MPTLPRLVALLLLGLVPAVQAQSNLREQEIAQCQPQEVATWGDGRDRRAAAAGSGSLLLPTACDIARCRALNAPPLTAALDGR